MTSTAPNDAPLPALFQPFAVRGTRFRNRIVLTPMCQYASEDGHVSPWHFDHHARFATGGVGGALVESTGVTRDGRITPSCLGIYLDAHIDGLSRIVDIYHRHGVPVGIQLSHSGRKGSAASPRDGAQPLVEGRADEAWEAVAPSAVALTPDWPVPRALGGEEIATLIDEFALAARRAVRAGFDFVEIHGAHGYLVHSFVSPLSNRRNDEWGGDIAGRSRFAVKIAEAIRRVIPPDMPLFYRASAVDGVEGGLEIEDTVELARRLKAVGVDVIDCSSGGITGASGRSYQRPSPGYLVPYAQQVREQADMPTMAVGLIVNPQQANAIIASGQADLVAMGRQLIAEPAFPFHAAEALGHPDPAEVLPESYAFFLRRRPPEQTRLDPDESGGS